MNVPRVAASATLLPDGEVLVAGGLGLASAELFIAAPRCVPAAPSITQVRAVNGGAVVSWRPPANSCGSPILSYTVTATPYANSDHFAAPARAVSISTTGTSPSLSNLVADCHQQYTFTVAAITSAGTGPPSAASAPVKTSGYVTGPPPVVEILIDGESSAINQNGALADGTPYPGAFNPTAVTSYCPEAAQNPVTGTNFSAFPVLNDPTVTNWSIGGFAPQYATGGTPSLLPSHHYLTDAVAARGGVILPYSYAGAKLLKNGTFQFNAYSSSLSAQQPLEADVLSLRHELLSIIAAWPRTQIILVGHSWGGVIAEEFWKNTPSHFAGVARVFSLDSPINGTAEAGNCFGLHIASACAAVEDFFNSGNPMSMALVREMGFRWDYLQTLDAQIISQDQDKSYIDIGTRGDPTYTNEAVNGKFDSFIPQLVMSSCDNSSAFNQCFASPPFQPSVGTNCPADLSPWDVLGHAGVRMCPDTADLIDQAVAAVP